MKKDKDIRLGMMKVFKISKKLKYVQLVLGVIVCECTEAELKEIKSIPEVKQAQFSEHD